MPNRRQYFVIHLSEEFAVFEIGRCFKEPWIYHFADAKCIKIVFDLKNEILV